MTLLEREKPKVVVILNFATQSVDLLDYEEDIERIVTDEYDGDLECYLDDKHGYPTSNICYMVTTWEMVDNQSSFAMPRKERKRINENYQRKM